jgi:hypothetical protein
MYPAMPMSFLAMVWLGVRRQPFLGRGTKCAVKLYFAGGE